VRRIPYLSLMRSPAPAVELTTRFMDAYNRRDRQELLSLLAADLEYVRPGGGRLRTADEVMDQYERDWSALTESRVTVRALIESDGAVFAEISIGGRTAAGAFVLDAALVHEWRDGKLARYRLYADPLPQQVASVQPAR
jgi:ketosteroid isomerase-like protein